MTDPDDSSMDYKVVPTPHLGHCHFDFDSHAHQCLSFLFQPATKLTILTLKLS